MHLFRFLCAGALFLTVPACASFSRARPAPDSSFTVRDTAAYENMLAEGKLGVLYRGSTFVDSVDLAFGVHEVAPGQLVYLPVEATPSELLLSVDVDITEHVLDTGGKRTALRSFLPHFNDYFSSPAVLDGKLYYWGLEPLEEPGAYRVHAQMYDFRKRKLQGRVLGQMEVRTDFRFHFPPPHQEGESVVFSTGTRIYRLDPDLREVESEAASRRGA